MVLDSVKDGLDIPDLTKCCDKGIPHIVIRYAWNLRLPVDLFLVPARTPIQALQDIQVEIERLTAIG